MERYNEYTYKIIDRNLTDKELKTILDRLYIEMNEKDHNYEWKCWNNKYDIKIIYENLICSIILTTFYILGTYNVVYYIKIFIIMRSYNHIIISAILITICVSWKNTTNFWSSQLNRTNLGFHTFSGLSIGYHRLSWDRLVLSERTIEHVLQPVRCVRAWCHVKYDDGSFGYLVAGRSWV